MVLGGSFNAGSIIVFLTEVSLGSYVQFFSYNFHTFQYGYQVSINNNRYLFLGSVALGLAFGIVSLIWLRFIFNDTIIEMTLTLAVSYIAFFTVR